jgi:hypothetical protein
VTNSASKRRLEALTVCCWESAGSGSLNPGESQARAGRRWRVNGSESQEGPARAAKLEEAVAAYREALRVRTHEDSPAAQYDLSEALCAQAGVGAL